MGNRIKAMIRRYKDILLYLFFGAVVTVVNYIVYFPLHNWAGWSATLSNVAAWAAAVAVAFVTNKPFVFQSHDWSRQVVLPELAKFVSCRIASGLAETLILFVTVDLLQLNGNVWKLLVSVLVVVANYIGSKWLVFKQK